MCVSRNIHQNNTIGIILAWIPTSLTHKHDSCMPVNELVGVLYCIYKSYCIHIALEYKSTYKYL